MNLSLNRNRSSRKLMMSSGHVGSSPMGCMQCIMLIKFNLILTNSIAQDPTHPRNKYINLLPSGRRYRTLKFNRARFRKSLVPTAIEVLNNRPRWKRICPIEGSCNQLSCCLLSVCPVRCVMVFSCNVQSVKTNLPTGTNKSNQICVSVISKCYCSCKVFDSDNFHLLLWSHFF